jgi:hypothetical protein
MKKMFAPVAVTLVGLLGVFGQALADAPGAPEIDSTGGLTAIAMLSGILALVAERNRRGKQ